ncbi:MAG: VCBS repeat-containing protein [Planctomycetaceae bacterium]|nr:VCBS repeat-containing protein [Planctomycetaceae bacterium]
MVETGSCRWFTVTLAVMSMAVAKADAADIPWAGKGMYRLLVEVGSDDQQTVERDERPAELQIDLVEQLSSIGVQRTPDLSTLQVIEHEAKSGLPVDSDSYAYGLSDFDLPFRWYDAAIAYEFPEMADAVSRTKGRIVRRPRTRGGYFYNVLGDWQRGRLVWLAKSRRGVTSTYGIYFDLLPEGSQPDRLPPRSWVGDGTPRCDKVGTSTMGVEHTRIDLDDWNGDGLVDIIAGESYGHIFVWPNLGTRERPEFRFCRFVENADGQPLDAGTGSAPKVVDWDGDGRRDLLVGTHWNRLLFYRNVGTNDDRRFACEGLVEIDGEPLEVPFKPLARGSEGVFKRDYYPVPETVDWDADGDIDLLLGGYVTGRVFLYENTGREDDGTPLLKFRGPLEADGQPLNVGHWCAAPCIVDINGDGYLDLMSGNMPMHLQPGEAELHKDTFLQLYVGSISQTDLQLSEFPREGTFPRGRLATPRAADWDADGDLDLVVSTGADIYLMENTGTASAPLFQVDVQPIQVPWGNAWVAADQFRDWDEDGDLDLIRNYTVRLNAGDGNPYRWDKTERVLPRDEYIEHPSHMGDDWFWPFLDDFDQDDRLDVLFGDWFGHIWFHRNLSTNDERHFDVEGVRFAHTDGELIKVGPINKDTETDFDALQGARTVFTVDDFDRDGQRDLVVGDTYGIIRHFKSSGPVDADSQVPVFAAPVEIGNLGIRGLVDATDWNHDGWPDVIASAANGRVQVFLNTGEKGVSRFASGQEVELPPIIQPRTIMADLNGDGDEDLYLPSTQGACFVERSFLERGYASATLTTIEKSPKVE